MAIRHLSTNIDYLLKFSDKKLSSFFSADGIEIRKELQRLKDKGDRLIGSEGCEHFDPIKGCQCHLYNE
jgi:hypothetical protein